MLISLREPYSRRQRVPGRIGDALTVLLADEASERRSRKFGHVEHTLGGSIQNAIGEIALAYFHARGGEFRPGGVKRRSHNVQLFRREGRSIFAKGHWLFLPL